MPFSKREQIATTRSDYALGFHMHQTPRGEFCQAIENDGWLLEMKEDNDQSHEKNQQTWRTSHL